MAQNRNIHYVLLESQGNKTKDPLVLWLNGGPGCSSLLGFLQEIGPFVLPDFGTQFSANEYTWNKNANLLFFESPVGVGFSQNNDPNYTYTDDHTAKDNYKAMTEFIARFPEFKGRDFWITGESYAGMYIPWLANEIHENNQKLPITEQINLKGLMAGNGVMDMDPVKRNQALYKFLYKRRLLDDDTANVLINNCNADQDSPSCQWAQNKVNNLFDQINPYDIYGKCYPLHFKNSTHKKTSRATRFYRTPFFTLNNFSTKQTNTENVTDSEVNNSPCISAAPGQDFWNNMTVGNQTTQDLFHIKKKIEWSDCNDEIFAKYQPSQNGSIWIYQKLADSGKYQILIYSGDTDSVVSFDETQGYLDKMNIKITKGWRPWLISRNQVGGYITVYDKLTFTTVRGAGHMVPQWRRESAYHMFDRFINQKEF